MQSSSLSGFIAASSILCLCISIVLRRVIVSTCETIPLIIIPGIIGCGARLLTYRRRWHTYVKQTFIRLWGSKIAGQVVVLKSWKAADFQHTNTLKHRKRALRGPWVREMYVRARTCSWNRIWCFPKRAYQAKFCDGRNILGGNTKPMLLFQTCIFRPHHSIWMCKNRQPSANHRHCVCLAKIQQTVPFNGRQMAELRLGTEL